MVLPGVQAAGPTLGLEENSKKKKKNPLISRRPAESDPATEDPAALGVQGNRKAGWA